VLAITHWLQSAASGDECFLDYDPAALYEKHKTQYNNATKYDTTLAITAQL